MLDSPVDHTAEFRRCLIEIDVPGIRRLWRHVSPHLPQPSSDAEALYTLHLARSMSEAVPLRMRAYSKAWLDERTAAQIASAVGISVKAPEHRRVQAEEIKLAMSDAVLDAYKAGIDLDLDAREVRVRMQKARRRIVG